MTKSFHIVDNNYALSKTTSQQIKNLLISRGWEYNTKQHNYLFIVGGDGTLVRTLKNYYDKSVRIICVNTGNVGFYSKFTNKDIEKFDSLITKNSNYIKPCILEITSNNKTTYAINEVVIQSLNTVEMDIEIDNIFYETFKGTGILVCTKTGSTAQAKTNNGAIIAPNVNAIQLVELAPTIHANKTTITSPLILNDKTKIKLSYFKFNQRTDVITDGMLRWNLKKDEIIEIKKITAKFQLFFSLKLNDYIHKLHKTFISNV